MKRFSNLQVAEASRLWKAGEGSHAIAVTVLRGSPYLFLRMRREHPGKFPPRPLAQPKRGPLQTTVEMLRTAAELRARGAEWSEVWRITGLRPSKFWQAISRSTVNREIWNRELAAARARIPTNGPVGPLCRRARERHRKVSRAALMRRLRFPWRDVGKELGVLGQSATRWMRKYPGLWQQCWDEAGEILARHNDGKPVEDEEVVALIQREASRMRPAQPMDTVTQLMRQVTELTRQFAELRAS